MSKLRVAVLGAKGRIGSEAREKPRQHQAEHACDCARGKEGHGNADRQLMS